MRVTAYWNTRGLRGGAFEELINLTNSLYRQRKLAVIQKVPTPITPVAVDNANHAITRAFFDEKSTVDYIGAVQGIPVCFEAKETGREYLPLQNVHSHQVSFMEEFTDQGGVCFILVNFRKRGEIFFLPFAEMKSKWELARDGGRKSIPRADFKTEYIIKNAKGFPVHYLEALSKYLSAVPG